MKKCCAFAHRLFILGKSDRLKFWKLEEVEKKGSQSEIVVSEVAAQEKKRSSRSWLEEGKGRSWTSDRWVDMDARECPGILASNAQDQ